MNIPPNFEVNVMGNVAWMLLDVNRNVIVTNDFSLKFLSMFCVCGLKCILKINVIGSTAYF